MAARDEQTGRELAELARQFLLWLSTHELPGVPGLRGTPPSHFEMYAGVYRKVEAPSTTAVLPPALWSGQPQERQRLVERRCVISHVLLVDNPEAVVTLADGRSVARNRIVLTDTRALDRQGALMAVQPALDSLHANAAVLATVRYSDFSAILQRADLVYDDAAAATQTRFQYAFIFDYDTPRTAYAANLQDVLVPAEPDPGPVNNHDEILARRVRAFREELYFRGTYHNRKRISQGGGDYYGKWRAKTPLAAKQRQFRPSLLSDDYLTESFREFIMRRGDDFLMIDLPQSRHIFRLSLERREFRPEPVLRISGIDEPPTKRGSKADAEKDDGALRFPITAVFFRALDGQSELPTIKQGQLEYRGSLPKRFVVDYKAFVRWFFDDPRLDLGFDSAWFDRFVEVFFGDQCYPIELSVVPQDIDRERLFLRALRHATANEPAGPIRERMAELLAWCEADARRYVFTQGMQYGSGDNPRELIGITERGDVYEWYPKTQLVTRMRVADWLADSRIGDIAEDLYRATAGMLPFIMLTAFGGVAVMAGPFGAARALELAARKAAPLIAKHVAAHAAVAVPSKAALKG